MSTCPLTWRHFASVTGISRPNEEIPETQLDHELPAEDYFDLAANWAITEKAAVTLGINNVLDDNPTHQRLGGHDGQRQHLPADLRRPRSLRLRAGERGFLGTFHDPDGIGSTRGGLRAAAFFQSRDQRRSWRAIVERELKPTRSATWPAPSAVVASSRAAASARFFCR